MALGRDKELSKEVTFVEEGRVHGSFFPVTTLR
jgi:hypothetical protein